ncbi:MAG: virulence protein RhuM/Fic/DOC family protein [Patescibacteria group bacterium]
MKKKEQQSKIVIYQTNDGQTKVTVHFKDETVWLTIDQMAELFNKSRSTINEHILNIYAEKELNEAESVRKIGNSDFSTKPTNFYNLDVIISVGYRVKSKRGTQFRIWANKILKQYLLQGYAINEKRLLEAQNKFHELQEAVLFLQKQSKKELLSGQVAEILNLLADYSKTLSLLNGYDKGELADKKGRKTKFVLKYKDCAKIIAEVKKELIAKKEAGNLFGRERDKSFDGIIKGLYQTFSKKELYPTIEAKASHLLYLIIKDHPFVDGNKRTAAFLFVYFLDKTGYLFKETGERKINDNALTALALLVAESDPKDKEVMIKIIKNLLAE